MAIESAAMEAGRTEVRERTDRSLSGGRLRPVPGLEQQLHRGFVSTGHRRAAGELDFVSLSVLRFVPILPLCLIYCFGFHRRESLAMLRKYPWRLIFCGLLGSPGYNLALYYGQQNGVPPSVASLTTALLPLFVMLLAAVFLGEALTRRRVAAFLVALVGLVVIALSKGDPARGGGLRKGPGRHRHGAAVLVHLLHRRQARHGPLVTPGLHVPGDLDR